MNTRLQVEHPVSEKICKTDLISLQIKIHSGYKISKRQEEIKKKGHSIEVRLYSEDPQNNFFPDSGIIKNLEFSENKNISIYTSINQGCKVGISFDPMLAKIVSYGETREEAIRIL